jgi:hypothetical protein
MIFFLFFSGAVQIPRRTAQRRPAPLKNKKKNCAASSLADSAAVQACSESPGSANWKPLPTDYQTEMLASCFLLPRDRRSTFTSFRVLVSPR